MRRSRQDVLFLQLARAFQGIGGAIMFATALALLAGAFHGKDRGTAFGVFGATTGVAVAIGPVLGGVLTSGLSWRWIFFVNIPICVVAMAVTLTQGRASPSDPNAGRPDWFGFVTFSLALGAARLRPDPRPARTAGATTGSCVLARRLRACCWSSSWSASCSRSHPMFDLGLLRKPTFIGGLIAAFGVSASVFSLLTYLVIYVQNVLGYSAVETGVRFLFLSGAVVLRRRDRRPADRATCRSSG